MSNQNKDFTIRYDKSEIAYVTQFLVSPSNEEVLLDLSSGLLNDGSQPKTLPIQTRIALPWSAVERLAKILTQVVETKERQSVNKKANPVPHMPVVPQATIPQLTR